MCGAMETGLGTTVKLFRLYLEDGLAPSLDLLHIRISPWRGTKPIPRWDVHFRILKTTERTQRLPISPLDPN